MSRVVCPKPAPLSCNVILPRTRWQKFLGTEPHSWVYG